MTALSAVLATLARRALAVAPAAAQSPDNPPCDSGGTDPNATRGVDQALLEVS